MKRLFFTMLGAALIAAPALHAQDMAGAVITAPKVNVDKLKSDIAKAAAETADAKKGVKSASWIKLGEAYANAEKAPIGNSLYTGVPEDLLVQGFGSNVAPRQETIDGTAFNVYPFEHLTAYVSGGLLQFYVPTTVVEPSLLEKAYEAFAKAYQIDPKNRKIATGMDNIRVRGRENGGAYFSLGEYTTAADNFRMAFRASDHPSFAQPDTIALFYAGMSAVFGGDDKNAVQDLDKALEMGYESGGETYRLKFLAMYNLGQKEESLEVLKRGVELYPNNENLIDMMLRYYAENEGDPTSLIPMVQDAIDQNPTNPYLYQGLARVYDKLGQADNAIAAIRKAVELTPNDFTSNYLEGLYIVKKGDDQNRELGNMAITSRDQYQKALSEVNKIFAEAIAPLERAYEINPSEISTVEMLKNLTFRLRDDEAMNVKYEKYLELFNSMEK